MEFCLNKKKNIDLGQRPELGLKFELVVRAGVGIDSLDVIL